LGFADAHPRQCGFPLVVTVPVRGHSVWKIRR
jgi:hypothetical protein